MFNLPGKRKNRVFLGGNSLRGNLTMGSFSWGNLMRGDFPCGVNKTSLLIFLE